MADRRSFLKVLLGAGAIGPQIALGEAAAALGVSKLAIAGAPSVFEVLSEPVGSGENCTVGPAAMHGWRLIQFLRQDFERRTESIDHLPVHIRSKRSWSDAYKIGEAAREKAILDAYIDRLERDEGFAETVYAALGLTEAWG